MNIFFPHDVADPQSFLNASDDETIEFSTRKFGIENYPADYEEEWFLIAPAGRQIQITFEEFELEQSEKCNNAFVAIREAYFDDGPYRDDINAEYGTILAELLCGSNLPQKIQSSGNMACVKIKSAKNAASNFKGFKASFKAGMHQRYHTSQEYPKISFRAIYSVRKAIITSEVLIKL